MIVVGEGGVVVVLVAGCADRAGAKLSSLEYVVIVTTEQSVVSQRELVTGRQWSHARRTSETLDVVDLALRSHHVIGFAERLTALVALCTEQTVKQHINQFF